MNRRGFLRSSLYAAVGVALAPIAAKRLPPPPKPKPPNFAALSPAEIKVWSREVWTEASANPIFSGRTIEIDDLRIIGILKPRFGIIPIDTVA